MPRRSARRNGLSVFNHCIPSGNSGARTAAWGWAISSPRGMMITSSMPSTSSKCPSPTRGTYCRPGHAQHLARHMPDCYLSDTQKYSKVHASSRSAPQVGSYVLSTCDNARRSHYRAVQRLGAHQTTRFLLNVLAGIQAMRHRILYIWGATLEAAYHIKVC